MPLARPEAPPYLNEGPHVLWHFSEDPRIETFIPHVAATSIRTEALVWAVDTRHAPLFWFPRDCPRGCAWANEATSAEDRQRFHLPAGTPRVHVIESAWLERVRGCRLYAYRMPERSFSPDLEVGGYWVSGEPVTPLERIEAGDLLALHAASGIELRITPSIWPWWAAVIRSTLDFSGSRLRNCSIPEPAWVRPPVHAGPPNSVG